MATGKISRTSAFRALNKARRNKRAAALTESAEYRPAVKGFETPAPATPAPAKAPSKFDAAAFAKATYIDPRTSTKKRNLGTAVNPRGGKRTPQQVEKFQKDNAKRAAQKFAPPASKPPVPTPKASVQLKALGTSGSQAKKKPKDLSYSSALPTAKLHARKALYAASTLQSEAQRAQMHVHLRRAGIGQTVKSAGKKAAPAHTLQHGKKGGTFYISNGKKVYAKK